MEHTPYSSNASPDIRAGEDILRFRIFVKKIEYPAIYDMLLVVPKRSRGKKLLQALNEALAFIEGLKITNARNQIDKFLIKTQISATDTTPNQPTNLQINEEKSKIVVAPEKNDTRLRSRGGSSKLGSDMKSFWTTPE